MLRKWWLVLPLVCLCAAPARALDSGKRISQYAHAAWRIQDGFFKGSPLEIAQTLDGYLWVGTTSQLLRFDGVRFDPWHSANDAQLPNSQIYALQASRDGSLWIGTRGGLSRWKDDVLTNYATPGGAVLSILEDHKGDIWFGQYTDAGTGPLCRVVGAGVRCLSDGDGMPRFRMPNALAEDARGNVWIGGDKLLVRWSLASQTVYRPDGLATNFARGFAAVVPTADGNLWVGIDRAGPGLGLQHVIDGRWSSVRIGDFDGSTLVVNDLFVDREGTLWISTEDRGVFRLRDLEIDHYDRTNGLSGDWVQRIREDREGNIWVMTHQGIDRFSDTPVVTFSDAEGLCSSEVMSVQAARDGGAWIGGSGGVTHLAPGHASCLRKGEGLPGVQVTSLLEDHAGQLLADTMTLRDLYKKHHWQVAGQTFYQLHLLFDKHYDEQNELVDKIAERIQLLGGVGVAMPPDIAETTLIPRPPKGREEVLVQISRLLHAHEIVLKEARTMARRAADAGDDGTNDLLVSDVIKRNEFQVWFVAEHLVAMPLVQPE